MKVGCIFHKHTPYLNVANEGKISEDKKMYLMKNTLVSIHPLLLKLAHRIQKEETQFLVKHALCMFTAQVLCSEVSLKKGSEAKGIESRKEGPVSRCAARGYKNQ